MHELSIAAALVSQLSELVLRESAVRVVSATVTVGSLSGVDPEALQMAFPLAAEGSSSSGAELKIRWVPARLRCAQCDIETLADDPVFLCSHCGSQLLTLTAGRDLHLVEAELA